jgi:hypothetical protein
MGGVRQVSFGDDAMRDGGVMEFVRQATEGGVEVYTTIAPDCIEVGSCLVLDEDVHSAAVRGLQNELFR